MGVRVDNCVDFPALPILRVTKSMDDVLKAIAEVLFEIVWRGPGYLVLRAFRSKEHIKFEGCLVLAVGLAFWLAVALVVWGAIELLS